jgi:hypothetical protein
VVREAHKDEFLQGFSPESAGVLSWCQLASPGREHARGIEGGFSTEALEPTVSLYYYGGFMISPGAHFPIGAKTFQPRTEGISSLGFEMHDDVSVFI